MKHNSIIESPYFVNISNGKIQAKELIESCKYLKDLSGFFEDEPARSDMDQNTLVYEVQAILPVSEGTEGGLFYGRSIVYPGKVGDEYFMTKGHFHNLPDRAEFYWGLEGEGMLVLMDRQRNTWAEKMFPGSLHYIPGNIAHRTVNTSHQALVIGACWPSDAGHDYAEIAKNGFSSRLKEVKGMPQLVG
jgi:glucose-6-phosphate isomerase